jgi:hypothetical protein
VGAFLVSASTDVILIARRAYRNLSRASLTGQVKRLLSRVRRGGMALLRRGYNFITRIPVVGGAARMLVMRLRRDERPNSWYRDPRTEVILAGLARLNSEVVRLKTRIDLLEKEKTLLK